MRLYNIFSAIVLLATFGSSYITELSDLTDTTIGQPMDFYKKISLVGGITTSDGLSESGFRLPQRPKPIIYYKNVINDDIFGKIHLRLYFRIDKVINDYHFHIKLINFNFLCRMLLTIWLLYKGIHIYVYIPSHWVVLKWPHSEGVKFFAE